MDYVDFIKQNIGRVEEQKLTSKYYEPKPKVGISIKKT